MRRNSKETEYKAEGTFVNKFLDFNFNFYFDLSNIGSGQTVVLKKRVPLKLLVDSDADPATWFVCVTELYRVSVAVPLVARPAVWVQGGCIDRLEAVSYTHLTLPTRRTV